MVMNNYQRKKLRISSIYDDIFGIYIDSEYLDCIGTIQYIELPECGESGYNLTILVDTPSLTERITLPEGVVIKTVDITSIKRITASTLLVQMRLRDSLTGFNEQWL